MTQHLFPCDPDQPVNDKELAKPLKVAVVGSAPSSVHLAPYNDSSWQIWACSPANMKILPRVDAWFELHAMVELLEDSARSWAEPYLNWLCEQKFTVFMQEQNATVPNAVKFPKEELVQDFGPHFMSSSIAWMIALALKSGATEIAIYGVDMAANGEYLSQRPAIHHFYYIAKAMGVSIRCPPESDVLRTPPMYGYHDATWMGRKLTIRKQELARRIADAIARESNAAREKLFLEGAMDDLQWHRRTWVDG